MDRVAAVVPSVDEASVAGWAAAFDDMFAQVVAPAFARREPRLRARAYLRGLVSGLERKNGWSLAEFAGDATPDGMQRLLNAARWDADGVRDALGRYVTAHLGDPGAVLVADDTGFQKSGVCSAGVQRQYTGTATKPELAKSMIKRVLAAGLPFGWFTADEGYGDNGPLRRWLEEGGIA